MLESLKDVSARSLVQYLISFVLELYLLSSELILIHRLLTHFNSLNKLQ